MDVYDHLHKAENTAWARASAYTIYKGGKYVGVIKVAHPNDGAGWLRAFLWDWTDERNTLDVQMGKANGGGYDKLSAALDGLKFGEIIFGNHPDKGFKLMLHEAGYELNQII